MFSPRTNSAPVGAAIDAKTVQRGPHVAGVLLGAGLLLWSGCVTPAVVRDVRVTASRHGPVVRSGSFQIVGQPERPEDAKPTEEAVALVRRGLAGKGYRESTGTDGADLLITVSCGASGPSIQQTTVQEPIYRVVQAPSRYERVQVGNTPGDAPMYEMRLVESPAIQKLAGYREVPRETKVFQKYVRLSAHENRAGTGPTVPAAGWTVESVCEDAGTSVSEIVPVLTVACLVYVGKETAGTDVMHISEADKDVASLRRGN